MECVVRKNEGERKMDRLEKILELVKEKQEEGEPGYMADLGEELGMPDKEMILVCGFLEKHGLITMDDATDGVQITPSGLQLLNLPDLPEGELPSDQLEVLEQHWGDEMGETEEEGGRSEEDFEKLKRAEKGGKK